MGYQMIISLRRRIKASTSVELVVCRVDSIHAPKQRSSKPGTIYLQQLNEPF